MGKDRTVYRTPREVKTLQYAAYGQDFETELVKTRAYRKAHPEIDYNMALNDASLDRQIPVTYTDREITGGPGGKMKAAASTYKSYVGGVQQDRIEINNDSNYIGLAGHEMGHVLQPGRSASSIPTDSETKGKEETLYYQQEEQDVRARVYSLASGNPEITGALRSSGFNPPEKLKVIRDEYVQPLKYPLSPDAKQYMEWFNVQEDEVKGRLWKNMLERFPGLVKRQEDKQKQGALV